MTDFQVETNINIKPSVKRLELIKQIESLQSFYYDIGYDTQNIKTIFSLTLSFLKGQVNKLVVRSFFDVLMTQNKLTLNKEINLLNCFDELLENYDQMEQIAPALSIEESKAESVKVPAPEQQHLNFKEAA